MSDKISRTVYPNLHFPRHRMPQAGPPALDLPLEMIPDFRPEQAFLKSIRRYLNPRAEGEPSAAEDPDTSRLKAFDWGAETLDVDWRGIFRLALKAQVTQPFVVAVVTFFASLALKSVRAYVQTAVRNAMH